MEAKNFHIIKWQNLQGTEYLSRFIEPTWTEPIEILYRAWVLSDPTIVKNPINELPQGFFSSWDPLGPSYLPDFLHGTNYDLSRLYDLIIEPQYGFENEDLFVKPVSIGKRIYRTDRKPKIEVWSYYEDVSTVHCSDDMITFKKGGFQRMF